MTSQSARTPMPPTFRLALSTAVAWLSVASAAPLPPADAASAAPKEAWALAMRTNDHRTIIYRYIATLGPNADEQLEQPDRVTLTWQYDAEANNGMPSDVDQAGMDELEDALAPAVERDGFSNLALVRTGGGERAWVYYTRSGDAFLARMHQALRGHPALPFKADVVPDPGWAGFEAFVRDVVR